MRLFTAVWPPADVATAIEQLERPEHAAVRWTTREQWHITLRFHGEVAEDDVAGGVEGLHELGAMTAPRMVTLGPDTRRVRRSVLVIPVMGLDDLTDRAHLTVARARGNGPLPSELAGLPLQATWHVDEITLVRSHLEPTGARYETLATVRLVG